MRIILANLIAILLKDFMWLKMDLNKFVKVIFKLKIE